MVKAKEDMTRSPILSDKALRRWWIGLWVVLIACVLAQFAMHPHPYFEIDGIFGFYALFGFMSCVAIVVISKLLGKPLKRKESYYAELEDE